MSSAKCMAGWAAVLVWLLIAEGPSLSAADCNGNGVDDAQDIASGTSRDCDGSGWPDECDLFETQSRLKFLNEPETILASWPWT